MLFYAGAYFDWYVYRKKKEEEEKDAIFTFFQM